MDLSRLHACTPVSIQIRKGTLTHSCTTTTQYRSSNKTPFSIMYVFKYGVCMCICMHVCMCVCMCACVCVYMSPSGLAHSQAYICVTTTRSASIACEIRKTNQFLSDFTCWDDSFLSRNAACRRISCSKTLAIS